MRLAPWLVPGRCCVIVVAASRGAGDPPHGRSALSAAEGVGICLPPRHDAPRRDRSPNPACPPQVLLSASCTRSRRLAFESVCAHLIGNLRLSRSVRT